ncbi:hypothetical protein [Lutibacter sp.]
METKKDLKYEKQKEQVLQVAEEHFGKTYFEKLEEILSKIEFTDKKEKFEYTITVNNKGAFYASEK